MKIVLNSAIQQFSAINNQNNRSITTPILPRQRTLTKDKVSFGVSDAYFNELLQKTVKGSKKDPSIVDTLSFAVQFPSDKKTKALKEAVKKADDWYKGVLEGLAEDWNIKLK